MNFFQSTADLLCFVLKYKIMAVAVHKWTLWVVQHCMIIIQDGGSLQHLVQKSKMAAGAILNYNFAMLDHPRSSFVHLKFSFKFCVDRVRTFRDILIRKFCTFGLKCLFRPPRIMFWGVLTPKHYFLSSRLPKWDTLRGNTRFEP